MSSSVSPSDTDVRAHATDGFLDRYNAAPSRVQKDFQKQLGYLLRDPRHKSLRAKKIDPTRGTYQARVNQDWRFYYRIEGDTYLLLSIIPHPK